MTQVQLIRDIKWATSTCTLSFNTFGIWHSSGEATNTASSSSSTSLDGTDINACCASESNGLLAAVDDFGKVNLYAFPCSGNKCERRVYKGHSSHVTNVTFVNSGTRLITVGGNDMAIFQWAIVKEWFSWKALSYLFVYLF